MNVPLINYREQFHLKHGGECVNLGGGILLYADGARMEESRYGSMQEPPDDPYERCRLVVRYHEAQLNRAVEKFEEARRHLKSLAESSLRSGYGAPSRDELDKLRGLQRVVRDWQKRLEAAKRELKAHAPMQKRVADNQTNLNKADTERFLSELSSINI